jgi:hypothetical protein
MYQALRGSRFWCGRVAIIYIDSPYSPVETGCFPVPVTPMFLFVCRGFFFYPAQVFFAGYVVCGTFGNAV